MSNMFYYVSSCRDAMGDFYKNLVNSLPNKKDTVVVIPYAYDNDEFSDEFLLKIHEDLSNEQNKIKRYFRLPSFNRYINLIIYKYHVKSIYFQMDQFVYNIGIVAANPMVKYTMWIHDTTLHDGEPWVMALKRKCTIKFLISRINNVIVSYNDAKYDFIEKFDYKNKINKNKIHVVYLPRMKEMEYPAIKKQITKIKYDFIFYGRIEKYKGLDILLKAMSDPIMSDIRLLIVGRGHEANMIKSYADVLPNVKFINEYVPNEELARYICESECVILPYRTATGTQTVQIANYYDRPVLATKVGCFPEYIDEGINGFFIQSLTPKGLVEAMLSLKNKTICTDNIKQHLELFDLGVVGEKIENIIR